MFQSLLAAILAFLIFLFGLPASLPLVMWYARKGNYPFWLVTPDDDFWKHDLDLVKRPPHFGYYEASVRAIYKRFGRYWGDVYWLSLRNRFYGLLYMLKPAILKKLIDYGYLQEQMRRETYAGFITVIWLRKNSVFPSWWEVKLNFRLFGVIFGHKLEPIWNYPPGRPVPAYNMDGRPTFSIRGPRSM